MSSNGGPKPKRILILGRAPFGKRMSSPGIRTRHMAEVLSSALPEARVTLAVPKNSEPPADPATLPYDFVTYTQKKVPSLIWNHDIIICNDFPPSAMLAFPWKKYLLDYYTIYFIEWMEVSRDDREQTGRKQAKNASAARRRIGAELLLADRVIVANDRQKDYYIGAMIGLGMIDPDQHDREPKMRRLIDAAPHGVRPDPLVKTGKPVLKNVYAGIKDTDKVIIWNGGILRWYDPLTLLRALAKVRQQRDDVKLVFVGGAYPGLGSMGLGGRFMESIELAKELGLYNNSVFFDMSWVPYEQMKDYMLESDLSACIYFDTLETHFSLRTRFVDVFWAELPLICTEGDVFAEMVRDRGLGIVVPENDVDAVADAILKITGDDAFREQCKRNIRENNARMQWDVALDAMVDFCREPDSGALPKWRRSFLVVGAWLQWFATRAAWMFIR